MVFGNILAHIKTGGALAKALVVMGIGLAGVFLTLLICFLLILLMNLVTSKLSSRGKK